MKYLTMMKEFELGIRGELLVVLLFAMKWSQTTPAAVQLVMVMGFSNHRSTRPQNSFRPTKILLHFIIINLYHITVVFSDD